MQRERKQVDSTHSGQDENMEPRDDEEDDVSSVETNDDPTSPPYITGGPEVGDDWSDDVFHVLNRAVSRSNVGFVITPPVAPDTSVGVPRASAGRAEDTPPSPRQDNQRIIMDPTSPPYITGGPEVGDDWSDDVFHVLNRAVSRSNVGFFITPPVAPDTSVGVPRASAGRAEDTPPSPRQDNQRIIMGPTSPPYITGGPEVGDDWSDDVFHVLNRAVSRSNVGFVITPPVAPDTSVGVPRASAGRAEDTPPSPRQDNQRIIMEINSCFYEIGIQLGAGGFGTVYAATRLEDGLQVAVKFAYNDKTKFVSVDGYAKPIPLEVALHNHANHEPRVPQIIQLLDWQVEPDHYIMVLERPVPCQSLYEFLQCHKVGEDLARVIMRQATYAAQMCCHRGVLHSDIKLENLLITLDTLQVKLIDFGCGELLTSSFYTSYCGTQEYCPPEVEMYGKYHGEPATVWSLGIILFEILLSRFPMRRDLCKMTDHTWTRDGLSQECCDLICCCLQNDPEKRIELKKVSLHNWFKLSYYSGPLPLELRHQHSQERPGASDTDSGFDSDAPGDMVLSTVVSGLSSRWKSWWVTGILTLISCFLTTGYVVYRPVHTEPTGAG